MINRIKSILDRTYTEWTPYNHAWDGLTKATQITSFSFKQDLTQFVGRTSHIGQHTSEVLGFELIYLNFENAMILKDNNVSIRLKIFLLSARALHTLRVSVEDPRSRHLRHFCNLD